uniref:isopeptide-forming domain-containing fimbrial protein n=1 Tax=Paenibacillus sp. FSL W7-1332 TaxID=2921702 RepID=UPI00403F2DD7
MKRKPIINRRFKYLMAVFIILFGQLLPLYPKQAEAAADNWLNFKYDGFSQDTVNQFTLNGNATIPQGQNFIRLTQPTTLQSGAAFNNTALCPRDNYSFSTAFSFKMSNPSAQGASDGLTFTLQTGTTSQNMNGGGLGYYGISPSFAVKYDTFKNDVYKDPSSNYVGLAVNGDVVNQAGWYTDLDSTSFKLSNGTQYYTWIDYNSSTQKVEVYLGTSPDRANASKVLDVNGIDLSSIFGGQSIHAGFTGSTGLPNYETHDIHSWYFVNAYAPIDTLNPNNTYKVNEAPVVPDDSKVAAVNMPVSGQVIGTDPDGDPLTYAKGATDPQNGTVTVNADGTWSYTPAQDFIGTDSFTVIANDGKCATAEATINVEVSDSVPPTTPQPPNACGDPVALINGSFEEGPERGSFDPVNSPFMFYQDEVPGWMTTDTGNGANVHLIEIWDYAQGYPDPEVKQQPAPVDGNRYAELNAVENGMLYQDVPTTPGQTIYWRLSHKGRYGVDTMQVRIGPATDNPYDTVQQRQMSSGNTAWETYTGTYTVPAGQTITRFGFEAVSTSSGSIGYGNHLDNIFLGTEPCVIADKSVSPAGDVFEGDELTYEVTVKNEGGDVAANTIFEDVIPEGTEYVPGSMKMVSGTNASDLTDADDTDAGHFDGSKVIIRLGDLQNTKDLPDGITVQFKVKALFSHVGQTVTNKAAVDYKNLLIDKDETTESNETTSQIIEREVVNACTRPVALINGSFEEPAYTPGDPKTPTGPGYTFPQDENVPGWHTTDSTGRYDIFVKSLMEAPGTPAGNKHEVIHGEQFAEINSFENATLYQDVETTPGQTIYWRLAHKGRFGVDTMAVNIGSGNTAPGDLPTVRTMSTDKDAWKYYSGTYTVPAGQTVTRFGFEAISSAGGNITGGNFIDDVFLGTEPCVIAEKFVSPVGQALVGDEITYEVNIKNAGGDVAANTVFEDAIPAGTEYVPGSLKIVNGPNAGDLTDADDQDAGHFDGQKVTIELGDLPNTTNLPDGITVQFKVKALSDRAGDSVSNKANVGYKNLLTNEDETTPSNEVTTSVEYREPKLEANKTAELFEKATGNTDATHPEVGDTLLYTIQTRNTVTGSLVTNLTISDVIPAGLEYVPGTLKVDDVQVTDDQDGDKGHFVNGKIFGQFGDVTGTGWHKVTFQVKVQSGQAGNDIRNVAEVDGDNVTTPSTPEQMVEVYPRETSLESTKTAELFEKGTGNTDAAHPEVGDTLQYTIQTRNNITDSLVRNLTISDEIPAGLEYVAGTLKVDDVQVTDDQDGDKGHFADGKIFAQFGDVTDTEWYKVTFQVKILPGQAGKVIRNVAVVDGDNVNTPKTPREEVEIYPHAPSLESTKTAEMLEKAAGNTDAANPEVGDTLLYTIQTHNTIEDSLVTNLTISDEIPAGLEYVAGTLKVDDLQVTDAQGDDAGHFANGKVFAQFGDVTDTEWHKVTFQVKVLPGQAGKDIRNVAAVDGDNITTPSTPEEVVEVYPRETALESTKTAELFEKATGNTDAAHPEVGDTLLYTIQTHNKNEDSLVTNLTISDVIPAGLEYVADTLKVNDVQVTDDQDGDNGHFANGKVFAQFGDVTDTAWHKVTFQVKVLPGQAGKDIRNVAVVDGDNITTPSTPEEVVEVYPRETALESTKASELLEKAAGNTDAAHAEVGDTLEYTIQTRNTVSDSLVTNLTISDEIPAGLEYVAGTLKVDDAAVTDDQDSDAGHFANGKVFAKFGDVTDTKPRKVTFQVKVLPGQAGKDIRNVAVVDGDNVTTPSTPEEVVEVYPRETALESTKTAELLEKAAGNTDAAHAEVGDTLSYTIQTRNTASDSLVTNLTISDVIPAGLEYVAGTLKVNDVQVTDDQDGDKGHFANGKIFAGFGDVTDTELRKVTFQVKVLPGQAGKNIINIAAIEGDNVGTPDRPRNEVEVYPRNPQIETDKSVTNTNVTKATYEVGDTITYTIRVRGVVNDTYLENLTITDTLPAGLEYVPGSLKVNGVTVTDPKDDDAGHSVTGDVYGSFGNVKDTDWHTLEFQAIILPGQGGLTIENTARVTGDNIDQPGEPTEKMVVEPEPPVEPPIDPPTDPPVNPPVDPDPPVTPPVTPPAPVMESRKTSRDLNGGTIAVGDTLEYTISARNTVAGSYVSNLMIADILPEGLVYVAGSLKVDGVSVTDLADGDKGQYVNGKVSGNFGRITDTEWHTITFQATVKAGQAGHTIENIGEVTGDNVTSPEKPSNVIEVTDNENNNDNNTNPGGTGDSDSDSNEDPNGNSNEDTDGDSNGNPDEDSNGDTDGDSNTGVQTPDDHDDSTLGVSDSTPRDPDQSGDQGTNEPNRNKLPNTATNMYSFMLAGAIMLFAGLLLLRRKKV